jgi:hypothetical protein
MSGESIETRNANRITPPYASTISVLTVSAVAASQDLRLLGPLTTDQNQSLSDLFEPSGQPPLGLLNRYVRFTAVGTTVSVLFGATTGAVTGGNAPNPATTGINAAGACEPIPAGSYVDLWISPNTQFIGYIGAGAGTLVVRPASRGGQG